MSWQATAWVSTVEAGGPSGKLLLYALANYADEHGRCWPSDARLMADTEMAERTIRDWKRKLEEAGLLVVERQRNAGGTFRADEIRLAISPKKPAQPPANAAGGAASTTGKSLPDHRHLTTEPPASDGNPPTPPYKAEPSVEPPLEPFERERERDEDLEEKPEGLTKRAEALFFRCFKSWDRFDVSPKGPMLAGWGKLTWPQMEAAGDAVPRYLAAVRSAGMRHAPAIATYLNLTERLWEKHPPVEVVKPAVVEAAPFGPLWQAARLKRLLAGPDVQPQGFTVSQRAMIASGHVDENELMLGKQAASGWPAINAMHDAATLRKGVTVSTKLDALASMMVAVPVGSEVFEAWKLEHAVRGWPWLPDPGKQPVVYFPAGGPDGLKDFAAAIRGNDDDAGRQQAAE